MSYTRAMVIWCLVGAMAVLTVASFVLTGLTVDLRSNPSLLLSISGILAFSFSTGTGVLTLISVRSPKLRRSFCLFLFSVFC